MEFWNIAGKYAKRRQGCSGTADGNCSKRQTSWEIAMEDNKRNEIELQYQYENSAANGPAIKYMINN